MNEKTDDAIQEIWPPVDPIEPVCARRIPCLLAPAAAILAALFPKRLGPHLAASGWFAAYVAHLVSLAMCIGMFGVVGLEGSGPDMTVSGDLSLSEHLRRPFAATVLLLIMAAGVPQAWIGIGVGTVVLQTGVWLGAFLLMPLFSAGERPRLVYFRCVKLLLWSAVALIPIGLAIRPAMGLIDRVDSWLPGELEGPAALDLFFLCVIWWLSVLLRMGGRYGGPKDGPRWQSGPLRCERCSYALTGLHPDARCPECGREISDSLPDRRTTPLYARVGWAKKPDAFVRTVVMSWWARSFAADLSVQRGCTAAQRFAIINCVVMGLIAAPLLVFLFAFDADQILAFLIGANPTGTVNEPLATAVVYGVLAIEVSLLAGVAWLLIASSIASRLGWRDARQRTVVVCYATGWLHVPMLLILFGVYVTRIGGLLVGSNHWIQLPILGTVEQVVVIALIAFAPAAAAFLYSLFRIRIMLRETRFANG